MSASYILLPSDDTELARTIEQHCQRERGRLAFRRMIWLLAWNYLQGARYFDVFNVQGTYLSSHYVKPDGKLLFQCNELLKAIDQCTGRLAGIDFTPLVTRGDTSLAGMRERSIAQILGDSTVSSSQAKEVGLKFSNMLVTLGCCGISGEIIDHPTIGLTTDLELIHPRELLPFPSLGQDPTKLRGMVRTRLIPIAYLKDKFGKRVSNNLKKMKWFERTPGEVESDTDSSPEPITQATGSGVRYFGAGGEQQAGNTDLDPDVLSVVRVNELWTWGPQNTTAEYVVTSGDYVFQHEDYSGQEVYCPIGVARCIENGSFHGMGMFDLMFSVSRELETMLENLFTNTKDLDRFGFLVMPRGTFNRNEALREVGRGLRVLSYEPDIALPETNFKPFAVQPVTAGDMPGRVAQFAKELLDGLNPVRDLIEEKGRVDSAAGLQTLDEFQNQALTTMSLNLNKAFGDCYRAAIAGVAGQLINQPRPIPVSRLDLNLAGAVIDPNTNTVSFPANPLPSVSRLSFGVRQVFPRSDVGRKQAALERWQQQLTTPDRLIAYALKEGIDLDMWVEDYAAAYGTVVRNILTLFNDGETPGQVVITAPSAKPDFQLMILSGFMNSPAFNMSSAEVQNEFVTFQETLRSWMGLTLPNAIPNPDDMAVAQAAMMGQAPGAPQEPQPQAAPTQ